MECPENHLKICNLYVSDFNRSKCSRETLEREKVSLRACDCLMNIN